VKFTHGVVVGCGGTGSILVEPLARLLAYHKNGTRQIVLMDGDKFEKKNLTRQLFDPKFVGKNKAQVTAERLTGISSVRVVPSYINQISFVAQMMSLEDPAKMCPLVITAVDNHASRKAIIAGLDEMPIQDFACLIPGNELAHGRVSVYLKYKGQKATPHPFDNYPEIREPKDRIPGGCQKEAPSTPQLISANMGAAFTCLQLVQALLDGSPFHQEVHFNTLTFRQLGQENPIQEPKPPAPPEEVVVKPKAKKVKTK
jgi:hypothetical protein